MPTNPDPLPPPDPQAPVASATEKSRLSQLAILFLRLGLTAFGGPAAHIAMMQDEVVVRRKWLTSNEFLDMLAATNFIPGPNSTEMTIHIGYRRAGWKGLIVAGACFILPAAILCTAIAAIYVRLQGMRISDGILYGVKPVVIAIVAQALHRLAKSVVKTLFLGAVAAFALAALFQEVNELVVLFGAGMLVLLFRMTRWPKKGSIHTPLLGLTPLLGILKPSAVAGGAATLAAAIGGAPLLLVFLIFLKIGSVLFGSGYVLLAFLQADFVERHHWLTQTQLLDAIAVGQVTPGPVFTTATFIGYVATGSVAGAVIATVGIFLPAFFFVALSAPFLPRLRKSPAAGAFLDGLNVASLALMTFVLLQLALVTLAPPGPDLRHHPDGLAIAIALISLTLILWKNLNSAWFMLAGALLGLLTQTLGR